MATATEKAAEDREITERLRDPRSLHRGAADPGPVGPLPLRGFARPAAESGPDQPPQKRRLLSAMVKVGDAEDKEEGTKNAEMEEHAEGSGAAEGEDKRGASNGGFRRDGSQRMLKRVMSSGITIHCRNLPQGSFLKVRIPFVFSPTADSGLNRFNASIVDDFVSEGVKYAISCLSQDLVHTLLFWLKTHMLFKVS